MTFGSTRGSGLDAYTCMVPRQTWDCTPAGMVLQQLWTELSYSWYDSSDLSLQVMGASLLVLLCPHNNSLLALIREMHVR